ncbi:MAG: hypothetical protein ACKVP7_05480 [Hyphomicrobiaceae bacterium]
MSVLGWLAGRHIADIATHPKMRATPSPPLLLSAKEMTLELGLFLPTGRGGYLIPATAPMNEPTFALNRHIALVGEGCGIDFALSMVLSVSEPAEHYAVNAAQLGGPAGWRRWCSVTR